MYLEKNLWRSFLTPNTEYITIVPENIQPYWSHKSKLVQVDRLQNLRTQTKKNPMTETMQSLFERCRHNEYLLSKYFSKSSQDWFALSKKSNERESFISSDLSTWETYKTYSRIKPLWLIFCWFYVEIVCLLISYLNQLTWLKTVEFEQIYLLKT